MQGESKVPLEAQDVEFHSFNFLLDDNDSVSINDIPDHENSNWVLLEHVIRNQELSKSAYVSRTKATQEWYQSKVSDLVKENEALASKVKHLEEEQDEYNRDTTLRDDLFQHELSQLRSQLDINWMLIGPLWSSVKGVGLGVLGLVLLGWCRVFTFFPPTCPAGTPHSHAPDDTPQCFNETAPSEELEVAAGVRGDDGQSLEVQEGGEQGDAQCWDAAAALDLAVMDRELRTLTEQRRLALEQLSELSHLASAQEAELHNLQGALSQKQSNLDRSLDAQEVMNITLFTWIFLAAVAYIILLGCGVGWLIQRRRRGRTQEEEEEVDVPSGPSAVSSSTKKEKAEEKEGPRAEGPSIPPSTPADSSVASPRSQSDLSDDKPPLPPPLKRNQTPHFINSERDWAVRNNNTFNQDDFSPPEGDLQDLLVHSELVRQSSAHEAAYIGEHASLNSPRKGSLESTPSPLASSAFDDREGLFIAASNDHSSRQECAAQTSIKRSAPQTFAVEVEVTPRMTLKQQYTSRASPRNQNTKQPSQLVNAQSNKANRVSKPVLNKTPLRPITASSQQAGKSEERPVVASKTFGSNIPKPFIAQTLKSVSNDRNNSTGKYPSPSSLAVGKRVNTFQHV